MLAGSGAKRNPCNLLRFRHKKARYHGLAKNGAQVLTLFALSDV